MRVEHPPSWGGAAAGHHHYHAAVMDRLPFQKPAKRVVDRKVLVAYHRQYPRCEVATCVRPAMPEPHHLVSRQRGGSDVDENLISLCRGHHIGLDHGWHPLGGRQWYTRFAAELTDEARGKVERALRLDETEGS